VPVPREVLIKSAMPLNHFARERDSKGQEGESMSYLSLPRIYFGGNWTVGVATANNQPNLYTRDPNGGKDPIVQKILNFADVTVCDVMIDGAAPTDAELRQWMAIEAASYLGDGANNWNYYGANTASFQCTVLGFDLGPGYGTGDPLVGKAAGFLNTALCDLNPTGSQNTMMFPNVFMLGEVGLPSGNAVPSQNFSRWVWFYRNLDRSLRDGAASGFFQTVIPMNDSTWASLVPLNSPVLRQLQDIAKRTGATGLSLRYCLYLTSDKNVPQVGNLVKKAGKVAGILGLHRPGETSTYPMGRRLSGKTILIPQESIPHKDPLSVPLAPAFIRVDTQSKVVSLDLVTALPENGIEGTKVDLGDLTLVLHNSQYTVSLTTLGYAAYDKAAFEKTSGIVDIGYSQIAAEVESMLPISDFHLWSSKYGEIFAESHVLDTDLRNTFLQQNESGTITVLVTNRGLPMTATTVYLTQYDITDIDEGDATPLSPTDWLLGMPTSVQTAGDGYASITVTARKTGQCAIRFSLTPSVAANPDVLNDGLTFVRVLKVDDYSAITDQQLLGKSGFQLIYQNVFRFFYLAYPVMQGFIDFSNYEIMTSRVVLQELMTKTDKTHWGSYGYMPRTRDLTDARRELLARWCRVNADDLYSAKS